MNELVFIKHNDAFTDSLKIAEATGNQNQSIIALVKKHTDKFERFGNVELIDLKSTNSKRGRPQKVAIFNEPQATLLMTMLDNTEAVANFKVELIKQFYQMRRLLAEKQTQAWIQTRQQGKITRKAETDVLKALVDYAKANGSKNAWRYYTLYSVLANKYAGITDRDQASVIELNRLAIFENIILNVVREGIEKTIEYHEIYRICEERLRLATEVAFLQA